MAIMLQLLKMKSVIMLTTMVLLLNVISTSSQQVHAIVAQDGSGDFTTIMDAISAASNYSVDPYNIKIKKGIYREYVEIEKWKPNIVLLGDGMDSTIISGNRSFGDGFKTYDTSTVGVNWQGFTALDITFRNEAGPTKQQAVALRAEADRISFYRCRFEGYQDTLYAKYGMQFYRDCHILGTVDFICGNAAAVFQNCIIEVREPIHKQYNTITAHKRDQEYEQTGIVLQNCTIKATPELDKNVITYLGRPWASFARTVVMQSDIGGLIDPKGWIRLINRALVHPFYLEYMNRGVGADTTRRVKWANVTTDPKVASEFTVRNFISGDKWIPSNVPYYMDLAS